MTDSSRLSRVLLLTAVLAAGCHLRKEGQFLNDDLESYCRSAADTEYGDVAAVAYETPPAELPPLTLQHPGSIPHFDLTLQEAVQIAISNSKVLRDLGGTVLRGTNSVETIHDPAIQETDPRFGPAAALAAFDVEYLQSAQFENNDRALNNIFFGGGTRIFKQDLITWQSELRKRSASGSQFLLRQNTEYDNNNSPGNAFPNVWNVNYEMQVRHPLLQGGGAKFNRIAGPGAAPGVYNGVVIARINTNVSLTEFQAGLRNLVSDVENAYWDLYFAYRDLDAKIDARDQTLATWRLTLARAQAGRRGGEEEKQNQALEQYHRFQADVQNALAGRPGDGTRNGNGATPGVFRAQGGVQTAERRLRLILGLQITDGRLIRPIEEPALAPVIFDWDEITTEALYRRAELQRQREMVRLREMELLASKNHLLPQFDAFGLYRWRGFGDDLIGPAHAPDRFDNAYANLASGDFQEWQMGFEMLFPVGFRRAHMAVRNAQLRVVRERVILEEQQRQILRDLADQLAEVDRAFAVARTTFNRRAAALRELAVLRAKEEEDLEVDIDQILDAHRRIADAEIALHRALVEYALAVKNVHFEKGSLLEYCGVHLTEDLPHAEPHAALPRPSSRELTDYVFDHPERIITEPVEAPPGLPDAGAPRGELPPPRPPPGTPGPPLRLEPPNAMMAPPRRLPPAGRSPSMPVRLTPVRSVLSKALNP
ncbi:MAG: TolC family protein [Planctomycetes bacterium]|nr:TolC family protein [Planctomycetota bacterium]